MIVPQYPTETNISPKMYSSHKIRGDVNKHRWHVVSHRAAQWSSFVWCTGTIYRTDTVYRIKTLLRMHGMLNKTRKLCYRKDDRAMRPIGPTWVPWKSSGLLTTPTATIPNIFHGLMFGSTLWMFPQNLKSVTLPVPEIIGGTPKNWAVPGYAHASFSPKLLMGFYSDWPCKCTRQIWNP